MNYPKRVPFFIKIASLFSVVRGYNILVLALAQYLTAIFVFSPEKPVILNLLDKGLFFIVLASVCVVAAGYIINNFYDIPVDKINRPLRTNIDQILGQQTQLILYFLLNFLGFTLGGLVSWRAALFFSTYIFGIWLYSHKLKKYAFSGFLSAATLTILPFFAVFVYFKNFSAVVILHALFLFLTIAIRELVKDLENIKGAIANDYQTFAVKYGEEKTKKLIVLLISLNIVICIILLNFKQIHYMKYYFYLSTGFLVFAAFYLWKSNKKHQYILLHNSLKMMLLIGVFSLILINPFLLIKR